MRQSLRLVSGLYLKLSLLTIAVGFLLRIVLLFNEQTTEGLKREIASLTKQIGEDKLKGFILDLRNNPGEIGRAHV